MKIKCFPSKNFILEGVKFKLPTSLPHNKPYFKSLRFFFYKNHNLYLLCPPQETFVAERRSSNFAGSVRVWLPISY